MYSHFILHTHTHVYTHTYTHTHTHTMYSEGAIYSTDDLFNSVLCDLSPCRPVVGL